MENKRGQITLFIIIGIVILFGVFIILFLVQQTRQIPAPPVEKVPLEVESIRLYVQNCVDSTSELGWTAIGLKGGMMEEPRNKFVEPPFEFLTSSTRGAYAFPTLDEVKTQYDLYMKDSLRSCANNFVDFVEQGYRFTQGEINAQVIFSQNDITTTVDYPLTITKGNATSSLNRFISAKPIRFLKIYEVAQNISRRASQINGDVDLSYLTSRDINITAVVSENRQVIYTISDQKSLISGKPYTFIFVTDYKT